MSIRPLLVSLTLLPGVAVAAAPEVMPVTGFLTDDSGVAIDGSVDLRARLYFAATGGSAQFDETQTIDVDQGQFTVYLNAEAGRTDFLELFRDNGTVFLGLAVESGSELTPRFELATSPYASFAQYCDDAQTLDGSLPSDFRAVADPILWSEITGRPAGLDDGDQGVTYTGGTGIDVSGSSISLIQGTVEGFATGVAYNTEGELTAVLDDNYLPDVSCPADNILVSDGTNWGCQPFDAAGIDADVLSLTSSMSTAQASLGTATSNISTLQGSVSALQTSVTALGNTPGDMIAQFELDEATGATTFVDTSGLGNDVVALSGVVAGSATAHSTRSVSFSAATGLMAATGNSIPSTAQIRAELWMRTGDLAQTATLLEKSGAWRLRMAGGRAEWTVTTVGGNCTITHSRPIASNTWTAVSAWADGLTASVSINGVVQTVGCTTGPIVSAAGSAFTIGGRFSGTWGEVFTGNIDEVRLRPTAPSTAFHESGSVVNVATFVSATRRVMPTSSTITMETFTYNKKSPTSYLLIDGNISGWGNYSGDMQQGWRYGTSAEVNAQGLMYDNTAYTRVFGTKAVIAGYTTTGPQTLTFRYYTANGSSGDAPFVTYNPNGSDQGRLAQTSSVYTVWEIEP